MLLILTSSNSAVGMGTGSNPGSAGANVFLENLLCWHYFGKEVLRYNWRCVTLLRRPRYSCSQSFGSFLPTPPEPQEAAARLLRLVQGVEREHWALVFSWCSPSNLSKQVYEQNILFALLCHCHSIASARSDTSRGRTSSWRTDTPLSARPPPFVRLPCQPEKESIG